jgi:hypothetical protein
MAQMRCIERCPLSGLTRKTFAQTEFLLSLTQCRRGATLVWLAVVAMVSLSGELLYDFEEGLFSTNREIDVRRRH